MPIEYRDEYSQAKIFVPTQSELHLQSSLKEVEETKKELNDKLSKLDKLIERYSKEEKDINGI